MNITLLDYSNNNMPLTKEADAMSRKTDKSQITVHCIVMPAAHHSIGHALLNDCIVVCCMLCLLKHFLSRAGQLYLL